MKSRNLLIMFALFVVVAASGWAYLKVGSSGEAMTATAEKYLATLDDEQLKTSLMDYGSKERVGWHFIPKDHRKGLQIKHMKEGQRKAALALLESCLSKVGYTKATKIMELESVLAALEKDRKGGPVRDAERYYYTVFGKPTADGQWGLSIEGHHLSLNFVIKGNQVVSSTPTFFAANPTILTEDIASLKKGERVLAKEESLGFDLVQSLDDDQRKKAILDDKAPREIRGAGEPQPSKYSKDGISFKGLNKEQRKTLRQLISVYANSLPADVCELRLGEIKEAGFAKVYFAWAGADKPGIGHYYRIQGPTFLIEFVNTQADAAGNPASHIHCVWRDVRGDFAIPIDG